MIALPWPKQATRKSSAVRWTRTRQPSSALLGRRTRHRCDLIEDAPPRPRLLGEDPCVAEDAIDRPPVEGRLDVIEAHHDRRVAVDPHLDLLGIDRLEDETLALYLLLLLTLGPDAAGGAADDPTAGQHSVESLRVALDCGQAVLLRERRDLLLRGGLVGLPTRGHRRGEQGRG